MADIVNQAAQAITNYTEQQNNTPRGGREAEPGRLTDEAKRDIAARLREKAAQTQQTK
jgi:hypothetical protein